MRVPSFITPNTLTVTRILLIPFGVYTLFYDGGDNTSYQLISYAIFFTLGMTDIVDGKWARQSNRITALGTFLDPVADKVMIGAAMISLSILGRMPWWITIVILGREVGITLLRLAIIRRGVIAANKGGKIKATFQNFGVGFYVLPLPASLFWFRDGFMAIAIVLTIVTGAYYVKSAFGRPSGHK